MDLDLRFTMYDYLFTMYDVRIIFNPSTTKVGTRYKVKWTIGFSGIERIIFDWRIMIFD